MGEAKIRRRINQQVLGSNPPCVYCGGSVIADTVEHFPPRVMFDSKHRPNELVFPACASCNSATRGDEAVAAIISRFWPDLEPSRSDEFKRYVRGALKSFPGLAKELQASPKQIRDTQVLLRGIGETGHAINCSGPIVSSSMLRFAAKHGFCLHSDVTGRPIGAGGGVKATWYTNKNVIVGEFPSELLAVLGSEQTLRQGEWNVSSQFRYRSAHVEDSSMSIHVAFYRQSCAVLAIAADDIELLAPIPMEYSRIFSVGELRN